ncbi:unnamed protein product, partial [Brassica oleracea]
NYSVHGRFRIAIENTVFDVHVDDSQVCSYHSKVFALWHARDMGLFPDVGGNISLTLPIVLFRRVSLASQELGWMALRCWLVVLQLSMCFQRYEISLLQYFWYFPTPPPAVIAT